jgi:hypothetical protein
VEQRWFEEGCKSENNSPPDGESYEGKKILYAPKTRQRSRKKSRGVGVRGGLSGVFGSSLHEGWPGIGVVETVNVSVKNDLMRAHVVVLKDGGESVVLVVEALVTPVGVDRSSRSRESATRAAGAG